MALEHVLLRDFKTEINTGTEAVPNWVEILGIAGGPVHKPKTTTKSVASNKSGGRQDERVTNRGDSYSLKGQRIEDPNTGARDPGQEAVEAAAGLIGYNSTKQYRITSPGNVAKVFKATTEATESGGSEDDFCDWSFDITVCGSYQ